MTMLEGRPVETGHELLQPPDNLVQEQQTQLSLKERLGGNQTARRLIAGAAGLLSAWGTLQLSQPSFDQQVGPLRVGLSANGEGGLEIMGEELDSPLGFVGLSANLAAPYPRDIPESVEEISAITGELRQDRDKQLEDILVERYSHEVMMGGIWLLTKTGLLVSVAGGAAFAGANEWLRPVQERRRLGRSLAVGSIGLMAVFGTNLAATYTSFDRASAGQEMNQALTPHIKDYFTDKTTKVVIDYRTISQEISKNLIRLDRYGEQLSLSRTADEDIIRIVVDSDRHGRNPHDELEAIVRAAGARALITLGDVTNRGSDFENDLLAGGEVMREDFPGIQDIRFCKLWSPTDPEVCNEEGDVIPQKHVIGNHDEPATGRALEALGSQNIDRLLFRLPLIDGLYVGASDGCFAAKADCHSREGDYEANRLAGEELVNFLGRRGISPQAAFVSHVETARALDGKVPVVFAGELHQSDLEELPQGTQLVVVGTSGQAFGRGAPEASATIAGFSATTGELKECLVVSWQGMDATVPPVVSVCKPTQK